MVKKSLNRGITLLAVISLLATGGCYATPSSTKHVADNSSPAPTYEKPAQITIMVDGTLIAEDKGRDEFERKWEELTGVDLVIIQPNHDEYYTEVDKAFESGNLPDVILLSSTYYTKYVAEDMLADIYPYYSGSTLESKLKNASNASIIEALKIKNRLYGISPTRGNGCITYIRKSWLDNVGMSAPTTYSEYIAMLKAFTEGDPDGNGINGDTYGVSAAGIINNEAPYINYLPEFYQDAYPSFYMKQDGTWADGFTEQSMKGALTRLKDAYSKGYIDPDIVTNGTGTCRNKFYDDKFGVFTYWAGTWAQTLANNLASAGKDNELVALPPLKETGSYLERVAPVWCITSTCKNPSGVYKYFLETMLDGGEVEELWTYNPTMDNFSKNHIDHLLAVMPLTNDPGAGSITAKQSEALNIFNNNSTPADLPYSTEANSLYADKLMALKKDLINKVVTENMDIDKAYAEFEAAGGNYMSEAIVASLNAE